MESKPNNLVRLPVPPGIQRAPAHPRRKPSDDEETWLVSYADMITLLFCFLVIILSVSQVDVAKMDSLKSQIEQQFGTRGTVGERPQLATIEAQLQQVLAERNLSADVRVRATERGLQLDLDAQLLFAPASAELNSRAMDLLDRLLGPLGHLAVMLDVEGHTDPLPIRSERFPSNWELSSARASSVVRYAITALKYAPQRLKAVGLADTVPVDAEGKPLERPAPPDDWTAAYLERQRRVTLVIAPAPVHDAAPLATGAEGLAVTPAALQDALYFPGIQGDAALGDRPQSAARAR